MCWHARRPQVGRWVGKRCVNNGVCPALSPFPAIHVNPHMHGHAALTPQVGLDYVSCSPLRVPIARLAAAQAAIKAAAKASKK